ncbi:MAG: hypothetical protein MR598_02345 [Erysipelotrichaceae bacterium]|nr:hypothetical protein [Erysipelotrichaceae bacterium]
MEEKEKKEQTIEQENKDEIVIAPVEEKKEKRSKKRLLLLLLLLIITGVMLSTSTYAWFTSNRTVTVEDIDVNVAASGGIQISVDGTSWKSIITNQDLADAHVTYKTATNQIPSVLKPVSTAAKALSNGYLSMWLGTVSTSETPTNKGEYILSTEDVSTVADNSNSGAANGENGHFVMFDLFIRLDDNGSDAMPLYLTKASNVIAKSGGTDLGTQNAARVAFINEGNIATGSELSAIQALKTTKTSDIYVWEPNYDAHTPTGIANAYSYYNSTNQGDAHTAANAKTQVPYFGTIAKVTTAEDILLSKANATDNATKFAAITPGIATKAAWADGTDYKQLFNLTPNTITKVRIYFWVEGQDIDCENNASGGDITLKLQFSLNQGEETSP